MGDPFSSSETYVASCQCKLKLIFVKVNSKKTKCYCHKMARGSFILYRAVGTIGRFRLSSRTYFHLIWSCDICLRYV